MEWGILMKKKRCLFGVFILILVLSGCKKQEETLPAQQEISVTPEPEKTDFSDVEKHVVWYHDRILTRTNDPKIFVRFNQLLLERGYDFVVDFVTPATSAFASEYRPYQKKLRDYKKEGVQVDLIFTGWMAADNERTYDSAIQDNLLIPLDDFFLTEEGAVLYEVFPENIWEMMRRDGKVYGVCENEWYGKYYSAILNKELLQKYKVNVPEEFSLEAFLETIYEVYEEAKQAGEELYPVYMTEKAVYDNLEYYKLGDFWVKQDSERRLSFVNPYEDENAKKIFTLLETYRKLLGDFGIWEIYTEHRRLNTSIGEFAQTFMSSACQNRSIFYGEAVTYEPQKVFYAMPLCSAIQGVSSWATYPEEAKTLLTLITTDEEFVNLLYYGIDGIDCRMENGRVYPEEAKNRRAPRDNACVNGTLVYPASADPENKKEILQKQQQEVVILPLKAADFLTATLTEEESKIAEVFREAEGLWSGKQENAAEKAEQYCERLQELNVDEVLQKMTEKVFGK